VNQPGTEGNGMDMLEHLESAYDIHLWVRWIAWLSLPGGAILLFRISGGFPPRAWHLLAQVIPQVPRLLVIRGPLILLPLAALTALSLTWLVLWGLLLWISLSIALHWWRSQRKPQPVETGWMPSRQYPHNQANQQQEVPAVPSRTLKTTEEQPAAPIVKSTHPSRMDVGVGWDAGIKRRQKPNEDSLIVLQGTCTLYGQLLPFGLFVVADGMGGHAYGQEASHLAIHHMMESVLPNITQNNQLNDEFLLETLLNGVQCANLAVHQYNQKHRTDMGTTITAALVLETVAYIVNVGDSRTYLYRPDQALSQVTRDHSLVARLAETGTISPDDIYTHPDRNQVYRSLGDKSQVEVDWFTFSLQKDDYLILCSDGLWEMVRDPEIERIVKRYAATVSETSKVLVQAALNAGGADNISVIVVHITGH
jgi:serine/threonine protein phosphatase PrpC